MSSGLLERLNSESFVLSAACISTPEGLRHFLLRSPEVRDLRKALYQGTIAEETIRKFVSSLMRDFRAGYHFEHEFALAGLAVVLERRPTDFAEEFLLDLAKLKLAEMPLCIRVARESVRRRATMAQNRTKQFQLSPWCNGTAVCEVKALSPRPTNRIQTINTLIDLSPANAKA